MNVHLFSKIDSPCITNWTVKRSAKDQSEFFDTVSIKTIEENFYMDDFLSSFHDTAEVIKIRSNVINILSQGGFRLQKFISNNHSILSSLPQANISSKITAINLDLNEIPVERALGIPWNPESDTFKIKYVPKPVPATKRGILSHVNSIFDPLGFITPALIEPKWIVQELWRRKIKWDESLPSDLQKRWLKWLETLKDIENITVVTWYGFSSTDIELDILANASKIAYSAVCYLQDKSKNKINCSFVMSKSRLAPVNQKAKSIPKLELQAALIASCLKVKIVKDLNTFSVNTRNSAKTKVQNFTINWEYYSSLLKLTRHLAWIIKLKRN